MKIYVIITLIFFTITCKGIKESGEYLNKNNFIKIECFYNDSTVDYYDFINFNIKELNNSKKLMYSQAEILQLEGKLYFPKLHFIKIYQIQIIRTDENHNHISEKLNIDTLDLTKFENHWKILIDENPHNNDFSPDFLDDNIEVGIYLFIPLKTRDSVEMFSIFY